MCCLVVLIDVLVGGVLCGLDTRLAGDVVFG